MGSTTVAAAIINIVINIIFIPKFGIYAASFSTLISNLIVFVYRRYKLKEYIVLKENSIMCFDIASSNTNHILQKQFNCKYNNVYNSACVLYIYKYELPKENSRTSNK